MLVMRRYSFVPMRRKSNQQPIIIIMFDNTMQHGGLLDRIKGLMSAKLIADELNYRFGIYTNEKAFNLFRFLHPVAKGIQLQKTQLIYNFWSSRPVVYYNVFNEDKTTILKLFKRRKQQYHFYCNADIFKQFYPQLSQPQSDSKWRACFHQLFYFDEYFNAVYQQLFSGKNVAGIHLRFQSLLGDNEESNRILPPDKQTILIDACIARIIAIQQAHATEQLLVVSDSTVFLHHLQQAALIDNESIIYAPGKIAHIDFVHDEAVLQKAVLDFYLLSKCSIIYQLLAKDMYNSQFCRYAAILGNTEYHLIII